MSRVASRVASRLKELFRCSGAGVSATSRGSGERYAILFLDGFLAADSVRRLSSVGSSEGVAEVALLRWQETSVKSLVGCLEVSRK